MKLNNRRTILIGLAFLSISAFWQLYDNLIPLILKNTFHYGETITGAIMALDNVLALFMLPLFGALSDKTHSRFGKRTPFIVVGTFIAVAFMILIPIADYHANVILFLISLGAVLIAMGTYRSPAVALMPDLTPKPLRSKANAIINLMGAVGGIYSLIMIRLLISGGEKPSYMPVFFSVALLMVISVTVLVITVKEKKIGAEMKPIMEAADAADDTIVDPKTAAMSAPVKRSLIFILASVFLWFAAYNAVTTAFSRYAKAIWNMEGGSFANCLMVGTVAAIASYIPIGMLSSRFGRKKVILCGILLMTAAYTTGYFFVQYSWLLNVIFGITGIGWAAINVNSYPMVVGMSRGSDIGKYTGLYYTFSMSAQIFTPIFSGFLLESVSYRILFPYAAVFSVLALCTMLFVRHGDTKPLKKANTLENFDVDD